MNCPKCKSKKDVVPIVYGDPNEPLIERADRGEVYLGGCVLMKEKNFCRKCNASF